MNAPMHPGFEVPHDVADWQPSFGEKGNPSATVYFPGGYTTQRELAAGQEQAGPGRYFLSGGARARSNARSKARSKKRSIKKRKTQKSRKSQRRH